MELPNGTVAIALIAIFISISYWPTNLPPTEVNGQIQPGYERLQEMFKNVSFHERRGIAMALMKKGQIVVDLWTGYADPKANQTWKRDTLAIGYSTSKVYAAIIFALLAREGRFMYNNKVSTIWPEFASAGKENTTIGDILDHKAGLLRFSRDFTLQESRDEALIGRIIEESTPQWAPGTKMGYSGIAYGYVIDQLLMRLDTKRRSAAEYFNDVIRKKSADKNFFIGLPEEENHRVARVSNPSLFSSVVAHVARPLNYAKILYNFFSNGMVAESSANYPAFLNLMNVHVNPFNSPDVRSLPLISCLGIGTTRAMAHTLHAAAQMLTADERMDLMNPLGQEEDFVLSKMKYYGRGFTYIRHPTQSHRFIVSFWGNGLQVVCWDPIDDVIFVAFRNGLKPGDDGIEEMTEMIREAFN